MFLYIFTFCVALTVGQNVLEEEYILLNDDYNLKWPDSYKIQATKISLTTDLVTDYTAWKTISSSRVDYNKGAVKSIVLLNVKSLKYVNYKIYPRNLYSETSTLACTDLTYSKTVLENILPKINSENLKTIDNETLFDKETLKFVYSDEDTKDTVWAVQVDTYNEFVWVPVRYESITYNSKLGSVYKHEIWDFYNFESSFDEDVFNVEDYGCTSTSISHTRNTDMATEELTDPENDDHEDNLFNAFKRQYKRQYVDDEEHNLRKRIFQRNVRLITSRNSQNLGYKLVVNEFADRTSEEMKKYQGLQKRPEGKVGNIPFPYEVSQLTELASGLPKEYDLRHYGLVSPVKNQGDCSSCWAFATASVVEGALARVNGGRLKSLSIQALVDCGWQFGAYGCGGGYDSSAYEWMMEYGLPTVQEYGPYAENDGFCNILNMTKTYPIRGYTDVTPFSVPAMKVALVNHGPLSVTVQVTPAFELYSSGIFYDQDCGTNVTDHEVSLIGYGQQDGEEFWILKNSWGTNWGEAGYMLISTRDNDCGVATQPTYVVI